MSQRSAGIEGQFGHVAIPRAWIIVGLGVASWFLVAALAGEATTVFQALSHLIG